MIKKQKVEIFETRHIRKEPALADYMQTQLTASEQEAADIEEELNGSRYVVALLLWECRQSD